MEWLLLLLLLAIGALIATWGWLKAKHYQETARYYRDQAAKYQDLATEDRDKRMEEVIRVERARGGELAVMLDRLIAEREAKEAKIAEEKAIRRAEEERLEKERREAEALAALRYKKVTIVKYRDRIRSLFYEAQKGHCHGCWEHKPNKGNLDLDHIVPVSGGGIDHPSNFQLLCSSCNRRKGERSMEYLLDQLGREGDGWIMHINLGDPDPDQLNRLRRLLG